MQPVNVAISPDRSRAAVTLYHPTGNIITAEMVAALRQALDGLMEHAALKLITITGSGADFSFGASIPEHAPDRIGDVLPEMHALIFDLLAAPAPTAAVVRGRCYGGGFELALACDFICAAEEATFSLPEVALGVFPPAASALLPLRIGAARATDAIVTGAPRTAAELSGAGLVAWTAPASSLDAAVDGWYGRHFAPRSASALRYAARAARHGLAERVAAVLPQLERLYLDDLMRTGDAVEGLTAFLEKRAPRWSDH